MVMRLIEIHFPLESVEFTPPNNEDLLKLMGDADVLKIWRVYCEDKHIFKILSPREETEAILDELEKKYSSVKGFNAFVSKTEAILPAPEKKDKPVKTEKENQKEKSDRKSVQEIHQKLLDDAKPSITYIVLIVLASIVCSIGVLENDVAIIIGSMVIAPIITPIMALSFSITLADYELAKESLTTGALGISIAIFIGIFFGVLLTVDPANPQIVARTEVSLLYMLLALSAGVAGSLSLTREIPEALVGVMVAVALLPPLVIIGLLAGSLYLIEAGRASLFFLVYLVSLSLAGIVTFVSQGIDPTSWWEKKRAKKSVKKAMIIWGLLLITLAFIIYWLL